MPQMLPRVAPDPPQRNVDGSLGPPGVQSAAQAVARLLRAVNAMAAPAGVALFASEVRSDPDRWVGAGWGRGEG